MNWSVDSEPANPSTRPNNALNEMPLMPASAAYAHLPKPLKFDSLPVEILSEILCRVEDARDLLSLRHVSRKLHTVTDRVLYERLHLEKQVTEVELVRLNAELVRLKSFHAPLLEYCQNFIRLASARSLTEIKHMRKPVPEIQTVAACLCLLHGVSPKNGTITGSLRLGYKSSTADRSKVPASFARLDANSDLNWKEVQRAISQSQFAIWYSNLSLNVNLIPLKHVSFVESVIGSDPDITYERMATVSSTALDILVVISACLHHVRCSLALEEGRQRVIAHELAIAKQEHFLGVLSGCSPSSTPE